MALEPVREIADLVTRRDEDLRGLADQYVKEWDARAQRSARLALEVGRSATSQVEEMLTADDPDCLRIIEALVDAAAARGEAALAYVAAGPVEDYMAASPEARAQLEQLARRSKAMRAAIDLTW